MTTLLIILSVAQLVCLVIAAVALTHLVEYKEFGTLNRRGGEFVWFFRRFITLRADVIQLDLDKLKQLNLIYGLEALDAKVKPVLLNIRKHDRACKMFMQYFSGDEFTIVVKHGDGAGLAARLLKDIQAIPMTDSEREQMFNLTDGEFAHFSATLVVRPMSRKGLWATVAEMQERLENAKKLEGRRGQVILD